MRRRRSESRITESFLQLVDSHSLSGCQLHQFLHVVATGVQSFQLREVGKLNISFIIQVDTLCHKLTNFIEKSKRAGVKRVFIGLENINPDSLLGASKRQNKITDYRQMLLAWKTAGIVTYCGYILGFPGDTPESIIRDVEIVKEELPVDLLEFFYL